MARWIPAAALALAACSGPTTSSTPPQPPPEPLGPVPVDPLECDVELTYVANAGVLLRSGDTEILIDAIHRPYGDAYAVLPEAERNALEAAEGRWSGIDLIVATHEHGDHVSPEGVASHLKANEKARFLGPPAVANKVRQAGASNWVYNVPWGPGSFATLQALPEVEIYNLRHVGKFEAIENIGVIITIDDVSVLHVGDASPKPENFEPFLDRLEQLDIAVLPTWFFGPDNPIKARRYYAMHIDPRRAAEAKQAIRRPDHRPAHRDAREPAAVQVRP